MNIVYFSSKVIDYVQIYLCEIPMYLISLISDAKYVIIQIQVNIQNSEIGVIKIISRVVAL